MNKVFVIVLLFSIPAVLNAMDAEKEKIFQECATIKSDLVQKNGLFLASLISQTEGKELTPQLLRIHAQWDPTKDAIAYAANLAMNDEVAKNKDLSSYFADTLDKEIEKADEELDASDAAVDQEELGARGGIQTREVRIAKYTKVIEKIDLLKNDAKKYTVKQLLSNLRYLADMDLRSDDIKAEIEKLKK